MEITFIYKNDLRKGDNGMTKLENMAADEFKKLPKKKQKEINNVKRIPVAKPGHEFNKSNVRCKRWNVDE